MFKYFAYKKLKKYNQEHLLNFYSKLNKVEQRNLINNIKKVDFKFMQNLYRNSYIDEEINMQEISPLNCIYNLSKEEKETYKKIGEELIQNNEYAIVLFAGGSASRLNLGIPKGLLKLKVGNQYFSLFELYINQLKEVVKKYNVYLNLYIMTSEENNSEIVNFFIENNYFSYPKENIKFFSQQNLPILDTKGNVLLKDKSNILMAPNGNGNVFVSMKNHGVLKDIVDQNIKYVLFCTIDNVLNNLIDFSFIGATISNKYDVASKTILKKDSTEKDWIFCKYKNKPFMLPSSYIDENLTNIKNSNGEYLYRAKNITYHLMSTKELIKIANIDLKYHRAYKKNNYIDINGKKIISDKPNTFKFEQFAFDAFNYSSDMLLYRVESNEFCPIKEENDIKKVEKILEDYKC